MQTLLTPSVMSALLLALMLLSVASAEVRKLPTDTWEAYVNQEYARGTATKIGNKIDTLRQDMKQLCPIGGSADKISPADKFPESLDYIIQALENAVNILTASIDVMKQKDDPAAAKAELAKYQIGHYETAMEISGEIKYYLNRAVIAHNKLVPFVNFVKELPGETYPEPGNAKGNILKLIWDIEGAEYSAADDLLNDQRYVKVDTENREKFTSRFRAALAELQRKEKDFAEAIELFDEKTGNIDVKSLFPPETWDRPQRTIVYAMKWADTWFWCWQQPIKDILQDLQDMGKLPEPRKKTEEPWFVGYTYTTRAEAISLEDWGNYFWNEYESNPSVLQELGESLDKFAEVVRVVYPLGGEYDNISIEPAKSEASLDHYIDDILFDITLEVRNTLERIRKGNNPENTQTQLERFNLGGVVETELLEDHLGSLVSAGDALYDKLLPFANLIWELPGLNRPDAGKPLENLVLLLRVIDNPTITFEDSGGTVEVDPSSREHFINKFKDVSDLLAENYNLFKSAANWAEQHMIGLNLQDIFPDSWQEAGFSPDLVDLFSVIASWIGHWGGDVAGMLTLLTKLPPLPTSEDQISESAFQQ
ncbi:hypothetical protein ABW19_dt0203834 [Dactylella cylindrospora]|nr:hypothetical protein ABW19_dt0203834 [Dactylella cylindrospora]